MKNKVTRSTVYMQLVKPQPASHQSQPFQATLANHHDAQGTITVIKMKPAFSMTVKILALNWIHVASEHLVGF